MHIVRDHKLVLLKQPDDGQYGPEHVVVHLAIKYTYVTQLCLTIYNFQVRAIPILCWKKWIKPR